MAAIGEREALEACRTLFGEPADATFLDALAMPSVKRAFRQKALLLHPDRFAGAAPAIQRRQTERFQAISGAYEALLTWLEQTKTEGARAAGTPARSPAPPRSQKPPSRRPPAPPPPPRPAEPASEPRAERPAARPPPPRPDAPPPPPRPPPRAEPAAARPADGPRPARGEAPRPAAASSRPAEPARPVDPPPPAAGPGPTPGAPPLGKEGLGSFLHRHGLISQRTLLAALVWQRRGRLRVGELAVRWGWLTPSQVQEILATRGPAPRFADRAVALGLLTPFRARALLRFQGSRQRRLGDYFVEHGVLGREQVERLAALHRADVERAAEPAPATATAAAGPRRTASRA